MDDIGLDMIINAKRNLMNFYEERIKELNIDIEYGDDEITISNCRDRLEEYSDLANKLNTSIILLQLGFE